MNERHDIERENGPGGRGQAPSNPYPMVHPAWYGSLPSEEWVVGPPTGGSRFRIPSMRYLLRAARRNAWLVLACTALATAGAWGVASQETPRYRARATLRFEDPRGALAGRFDNGYVDWIVWRTNPLVTESIVLRENREVAGAVVDRVGLRLEIASEGLAWADLAGVTVASTATADTIALDFRPDRVEVRGRAGVSTYAYGAPISVDGVRFVVPRRPAVASATLRVIDREKAIDRVLSNLSASLRKDTNLIDLTYTAADPTLAQLTVNALAEEFQAYNLGRHLQISQQRREFIEDQIAQMGTLLSEAYRALSEFRRSRQLHGPSYDLEGHQAYLRELELRRDALRAERDAVLGLLDAHDAAGGATEEWLWSVMTAAATSENRVLSQLVSQIVAYRNEREQLTAGEWGAWIEHPDVKRITDLIATTEARLVQALDHHVRSLEERIEATQELYARSARAVQELADTEMEELWLVHEVESIRSVLAQLRAEYQRARISESVELPQYAIVNLATTPGASLGTRGKKTILMGLVIGLVLGTGGAAAREGMSSVIRRREEIEAVFGIPGLAVIPRIAPEPERNVLRRLPRRRPHAPAPEGDVAPELVTVSDALSGVSDAFRILRTNLFFSHAVRDLRTILVTSPSAAEGKTTTAANLAVSVAQQGLRVALIDCDLRRSRIHSLFGIGKQPGLTDYLVGTHRPLDVVHRTTVPNLIVIPAGAFPPNPADLLGVPRMRQLLDALRDGVDLVIVDSPPVLAASEATILGTQVDGVMLVVRAGKTQREAAQQAIEQVSRIGARVVGIVINDPDETVTDHYYDYYYDYDAKA